MSNNTKEILLGEKRKEELVYLKDCIMAGYNLGNSYLINLYGRGGIGKTVMTKELYRSYDQFHEGAGQKTKAVYINASGCFDIPELLFRLRMEIGDRKYNFEKFDTLYELYYDASRFIQYKNIKKLEDKVTSANEITGDYTITERMAEDSGKLSELLLEPLIKEAVAKVYKFNKNILTPFLIQSAEIAGPIADRISIAGLILKIVQNVKDKQKCKRYTQILEEIKSSQGLFPQEEKLIDFFKNALIDSKDEIRRERFFLFIDNFQNPTPAVSRQGEFVFQNVDTLFGMIRDFPALWFVSSRNQLPVGNYNYSYELKGLEHDDAKGVIENIAGEKLVDENKVKVVDSILSVAKDGGDKKNEDARYSPLILHILCQVLEKEIENLHRQAPGRNKYEVSPDLFAKIENQSALTYYFEMGKNSVELDCFHILSCADIWDEYTLSVLRNKIQLYLLNTKYILAQDSMTEVVDDHSIKLHDEIAEALRISGNNRIRYDVYTIMYDAFMEIQDVAPIIDERVLRTFFGFSKAYCENILNGAYSHLNEKVLEIYSSYYNAFLKSIEKVKERISEALIEVYWAVVTEYKDIAEKSIADDFSNICEAYHQLGIVVYNSGDSKKAGIIDEEYLDFVEKKKDIYGLASALNALAYDLSANHLYSISYEHGKKSLYVALEGIRNIAEENELAKNLYGLYNQYFTLPEEEVDTANCLENIEEIIAENQNLLRQIYDISEGDDSCMIRKLWEQMLKTRGNIPWYFIENPSTRNKNAQYAVYYGKTTYLLRKYYYGENDSRTIQSYHNTGVYLLKYAEYCLKGEISDNILDLGKAFSSAGEIFSKAFQKRKIILGKKQRIDKENYLQEIKETSMDGSIGFLDIYSHEDVEQCYKQELSECDASALESLQYQSDACYLLAETQDDENEKKKFLEEAIGISDKVIIARSIVLGSSHRKTLESMRYGAEYYWAYGNRDEAAKRIRYALKKLNINYISNDKYEEYRNLLKNITGDDE